MDNNKNNIKGPFTEAEWYTMQQLRLDIEYSKKQFRAGKPGYLDVLQQLEKKYNKYLTKLAA